MPHRIPAHVGIIPDGNRRWADARGLRRGDGYAPGIDPGIRLLQRCLAIGVPEVSVYGFTKENVNRPADQVQAFRAACKAFARRAADHGAAILAVGDTSSSVFPDGLRPFAERRGDGDIRVNLLANYGWQWDLFTAVQNGRADDDVSISRLHGALASAAVPRIDLVIRWGGRRRLSGFLPVQCAYADFFVIDTLWPDASPDEFLDALAWYERQDVTLGG